MGISAEASSSGIAPCPQIGKYQILQHMATGGMAEIYLSRSLGIGRFQKLVVIKRILPEHTGNKDGDQLVRRAMKLGYHCMKRQ